MNSGYLKLGDIYWQKDSRTLFKKKLEQPNTYCEAAQLTQKQYDLLKSLHDAYPATLTKEEIIAKVWKTKHISAESLPQLIIRTRHILQDLNKNILVNEPGVGYRLCFIQESIKAELDTIDQVTPSAIEVANMPSLIVDDALVALKSKRNLQQPWVLVSVLMLVVLILFQGWNLCAAIHYKKVFEDLGKSQPYPYITKKDNKTIVSIEDHECIYNKDQQLLHCK